MTWLGTVSHAVLFVAMLPVVVHATAWGWWLAAALTVVFNLLMNGYPAMLQRYNRALLQARFPAGIGFLSGGPA